LSPGTRFADGPRTGGEDEPGGQYGGAYVSGVGSRRVCSKPAAAFGTFVARVDPADTRDGRRRRTTFCVGGNARLGIDKGRGDAIRPRRGVRLAEFQQYQQRPPPDRTAGSRWTVHSTALNTFAATFGVGQIMHGPDPGHCVHEVCRIGHRQAERHRRHPVTPVRFRMPRRDNRGKIRSAVDRTSSVRREIVWRIR